MIMSKKGTMRRFLLSFKMSVVGATLLYPDICIQAQVGLERVKNELGKSSNDSLIGREVPLLQSSRGHVC